MASVIDNINTANRAASTSNTSPSAAKDMEDRFMTLFLAQLQNQDPLNPMENAEMTSQLAQMNMVSGLEGLNKTMQTLLGSYGESLSLQAANLIGKNVLVPGDDLVLTENGALAGIELDGPADTVEVVITKPDGTEVARQNLGQQDAGSFAFVWDGKGADGEMLPEGEYRIKVAASLGGELVNSTSLQAGMVSALSRGKDGFMLEIAGLGNVELDAVKQVF
ncbi:MAG: flagellar hook assembly protein FlgD [Azovibrio sp.]|uniref:flagellar hook assembly protein FlgD n=1 Tax=Azovibrio sp. TaxID=1872673 RepID=UPI003C7536EE